jgi:hypothetical protein
MSRHHESLSAEEIVRPPSEKSFGITFAVVAAIIAAWLFWRKGLPGWAIIAALAAIAFFASAYLAPALLRPFNLAWLKFGLLLHKAINPLIMGLLFFLVFTPMGFVMRRAGKDFLRLARDPAEASYWVRRDPAAPTGSMKNQF